MVRYHTLFVLVSYVHMYGGAYMHNVYFLMQLDYCIIRLDEAELKKKLPNGFSTINLNHPGCVNDNDQIQIFQHPHGHPLSSSMSSCRIIGKLTVYSSSLICIYFQVSVYVSGYLAAVITISSIIVNFKVTHFLGCIL